MFGDKVKNEAKVKGGDIVWIENSEKPKIYL